MYREREGDGGSPGFTLISQSSPGKGPMASPVEAPDGRRLTPGPDPVVRGPNPHESEPSAPSNQALVLRAPDAERPAAGTRKSRMASVRRFALVAVALLALTAGGSYGYRWWTVGRFVV